LPSSTTWSTRTTGASTPSAARNGHTPTPRGQTDSQNTRRDISPLGNGTDKWPRSWAGKETDKGIR
jgi:hypothetical protein